MESARGECGEKIFSRLPFARSQYTFFFVRQQTSLRFVVQENVQQESDTFYAVRYERFFILLQFL